MFPIVLGWFETFVNVLIFFILINFTRPFITTFSKVVRRTAKITSWAIRIYPKERFAFERMMSFCSFDKFVITTETNISIIQGIIISSISRNKTGPSADGFEIIQKIPSVGTSRQPSELKTMGLTLIT